MRLCKLAISHSLPPTTTVLFVTHHCPIVHPIPILTNAAMVKMSILNGLSPKLGSSLLRIHQRVSGPAIDAMRPLNGHRSHEFSSRRTHLRLFETGLRMRPIPSIIAKATILESHISMKSIYRITPAMKIIHRARTSVVIWTVKSIRFSCLLSFAMSSFSSTRKPIFGGMRFMFSPVVRMP